MAKADRKKKRTRKQAERKLLRSEFALSGGPPRRQPNGERHRPVESYRCKPTVEVRLKRQALLNGKDGCIDDWIDVSQAQEWLKEDQASALKKFRGLVRAYRMTIDAPHIGSDALAGLLPGRAFNGDDEERMSLIHI